MFGLKTRTIQFDVIGTLTHVFYSLFTDNYITEKILQFRHRSERMLLFNPYP